MDNYSQGTGSPTALLSTGTVMYNIVANAVRGEGKGVRTEYHY